MYTVHPRYQLDFGERDREDSFSASGAESLHSNLVELMRCFDSQNISADPSEWMRPKNAARVARKVLNDIHAIISLPLSFRFEYCNNLNVRLIYRRRAVFV